MALLSDNLQEGSILHDHLTEGMLEPPLIVQWDGKLMTDTTNSSSADEKANADRVAVAVSGYEVNKILGITKTSAGTGKA